MLFNAGPPVRRWPSVKTRCTTTRLHLTVAYRVGIAHAIATSNERKIPPHLKIKPAKFHNGGFTQDLYMHICSISVKF